MWKIWMQFDIRRVLVGLHVVMALLAFTIHFLLLSTERYNWLDSHPDTKTALVEQLETPLAG
ncbi:MAG: light-harvesting protein [Erythrobacter sp.]|nr:light-harvesting protein [Erythrobacter sp.]